MRLDGSLPVETLLKDIERVLGDHGAATLCAPPGAGKTTLVPPHLLEAPWLGSKKILMLEPRRLAARAAAERISKLLGDSVGGMAGYRTRFDSRTSPRTRIEVLTEGILARMLQSDPSLEGVGLVIFDEFHERNIHADLGLALCLDAKSALREDLKLLVMSATLDTERVSALLGNPPSLSCEGRMHDVETVYAPRSMGGRLEVDVASALETAFAKAKGDILAFLPGEAEIRRTMDILSKGEAARRGLRILPLYGNLPQDEQDTALSPDPEGRRKAILATSIAETSLTIEGVRIVVDSGLMRVPRFCPRSGMGRLETIRVSKASAEQRRGRAGRMGPGLCIRLWSQSEQASLAPFNSPEILESDLSSLALELAKWGVGKDNLSSLKWMDGPPSAKFGAAIELLRSLGALDGEGRITRHGDAILKMPLHPRLAHMVAEASRMGLGRTACDIAALLSERDAFKGSNSDLRERLQSLSGKHGEWSGLSADRNALGRIRETSRQVMRSAGVGWEPSEDGIDRAGLILALAYPDRIAKARTMNSGEYALANGSLARLRRGDPMSSCEFLAAAHVEGDSGGARIFLAAPISKQDVDGHLASLATEEHSISWDASRKAVAAERLRKIGQIVISRRQAMDSLPKDRLLAAFLEGLRKEGFRAMPWSEAETSLQSRVEFLRNILGDEWPDMSPESLMAGLEAWLAPFAGGLSKMEQLKGGALHSALESMLKAGQRRELDRLAPERVEVPSGSKIRIDYSSADSPFLAVKLQELFGLAETPRVADGRMPLAIKILSPSMRPVQTTKDLASFWRDGYFLVRKELRGRYPKHDWPEDPLSAKPSRGVKRRLPKQMAHRPSK